MRDWYRPGDLLPSGIEQVIPADGTLKASVELIMKDLGLADLHGHPPG